MKMELFKLSQLSPKLVRKDQLFFDQYRYCFNFKLDELSALRYSLDPRVITETLDHRRSWNFRNPNFGGSWRSRGVTEETQANCLAFAEFLTQQTDYKMTISTDWGYIYTNDLSMISRVERLPYIRAIGLKEAVVDRPKNTLRVLSSRHQTRSYFRATRLTPEQKLSLRNFLMAQEDVRIGPGLNKFLSVDYKYHYINDNNFIDHNGTGVLTMMNLIIPRCIRKSVELINHK